MRTSCTHRPRAPSGAATVTPAALWPEEKPVHRHLFFPLSPPNARIQPRGRRFAGLVGSNSLFGSPTVDNALEQPGLGQDGARPARLSRLDSGAGCGGWRGKGDGSRRHGHRGLTQRFCDDGGAAAANYRRCSLPSAHGSDADAGDEGGRNARDVIDIGSGKSGRPGNGFAGPPPEAGRGRGRGELPQAARAHPRPGWGADHGWSWEGRVSWAGEASEGGAQRAAGGAGGRLAPGRRAASPSGTPAAGEGTAIEGGGSRRPEGGRLRRVPWRGRRGPRWRSRVRRRAR